MVSTTGSTPEHGTAVSGRTMPYDKGAAHRWVRVRGVRLHLAEYGSGAPLLLLHGFPQHWYGWRKVAALLAAEHRLIVPDLRGFGWSERTRRGYDTQTLAEDMLALLDALGLERVGLVGHSWGAQVGFRLCLRAPERFTGYLALNMTHPWPRHRAVVPNLWRMWFTAFVEYPVLGRLVLRHWPGFTRFLLRHQVGDPALWQEAELREFTAAAQESARAGQAMFWQYVLRDVPRMVRGSWRRHRLTVPTVLLGGAKDPVIAPSMLAGGETRSDDLTVRLVSGAGHHLPQERPEEVAEAARKLFSLG
ncbi:alpha/beta fold hydrolase [Streptomyces indicus]|uniref:Pimeloyl-ACP methyl ester carboxylesterase n=1 Tax=Streptomyces indicus TaxID=417292 RepID=A0A1G8Y0Z5_9ACTN|nr:alpha/beta hydrolase [Streptomyces indicus]SDJ95785.1 Pimeloyl-ACP methyl ester carboxylesterase [Streptomyces indicus]